MAKKTKEEIKSLYQNELSNKDARDVRDHYRDSWDYVVQPMLNGWEEKESILLGQPYDQLSSTTKSQVNDPRISTIALERVARVNAQSPTGKTLAMSLDDRGKNMIMNMLLEKWVLPHANSQFDYLIKNRLWDLYSQVYGVHFKLIDYVNNGKYSGPDSFLLPIRDCRPQAGRFSISDSDYFGVSTFVGAEWLKKRDRNTWKNIDKLLIKIKDGETKQKGEDDSNRRSFIERDRQPAIKGDSTFGQIELYTEYRHDRWITIAPDFTDCGTLRNIENPHKNETIPVVAKYCFPLQDSIYGLGEFERGKTLQFAVNSLINMYLDGVMFSIFPPVLINPDGVVPSSLIHEPAAKWLQTKPNSIQPFPMNPTGIDTFQNTYNFLTAAILNQAGTTDTTVSSGADNTQGKTPQALKMVAQRENTRDAWDRFMMERAIEEEMKIYVNLLASKQAKDIELRLFAKEIEQIEKVYPDSVQFRQNSERGKLTVSPKMINDTEYDYQIVSGSTYKADQEKELQNVQGLLNFTLQNFEPLNQSLAKKGKTIDLGELYERSIITSGIQDYEKIITDMTPEQMQELQMAQQQAQMPPQPDPMMQQGGMPQDPMMQQPQQQMPPMQEMMPMPQQQPNQQFTDPDIAALAAQMQGL